MPNLTNEQRECLAIANAGHNIVICGQAGTGKSLLMTTIFQALTHRGKHVYLTATTGIACRQFPNNVGGMTVHRYDCINSLANVIGKTA